jgi:hypothetical protein
MLVYTPHIFSSLLFLSPKSKFPTWSRRPHSRAISRGKHITVYTRPLLSLSLFFVFFLSFFPIFIKNFDSIREKKKNKKSGAIEMR